MKKILFLSPILLFVGCATKPKHSISAPEYLRSLEIRSSGINPKDLPKESTVAEKLLSDYLNAKKLAETQPKAACQELRKLAAMENFELHHSALVYSFDSCRYSKSDLLSIWKKHSPANYIKETYYDKSLELAKKFDLKEQMAEFSYELAPLKPIKSDKVKLLKDSVFLALKFKDKTLLEKYKARITEVSPRYMLDYNMELLPEHYYPVAKDFESAREFIKSRAYYKKIITGDFPLNEKVRAYNAYRTSYKISRDLKTFLFKTQEMVDFLEGMMNENSQDSEIQMAWVDAKINHARALWTEHQNLEGRKILDQVIEKKIGSDDQLATLYWVYSLMHLERKENTEALKKLALASKLKITKEDIQENVQWTLLWNKFQLKKYKDFVADASSFVKKSKNLNYKNKLNFWSARSLELMKNDKKTEQAKELYEEIYSADQFGYYGLISAMMLEKELPPYLPTEVLAENSGHNTLDWLLAADEIDYAQKYLKEINSQFKSKSERHLAMSLYAKTHWYQGALGQLFRVEQKKRDEFSIDYISMIYPVAYKNIYESYSQKYNVPMELALSITRQESTFNTNARSWADAFGLMQLIPEKASDLSKKYNLKYENFNDLYNPETNVQMGILLLGDLTKKFNGKFAQSVAGYNASTSAIAVWEKERFNGDYLEFIESVPYEETRNYIKLVFRNFITYKRVLSNNNFIIPKDFFEKPFNL